MNNKKLVVFGLLVVFILISLVVLLHNEYEKGALGYQYINSRSDDYHFRKDGEIVVPSTVIDYQKVEGFIVGLRFPVRRLSCDGGAGNKFKIENERRYFIFNEKNSELFDFSSKSDFDKKNNDLKIEGELTLDYSKFDSIWQQYSGYYKNIDFSDCIDVN